MSDSATLSTLRLSRLSTLATLRLSQLCPDFRLSCDFRATFDFHGYSDYSDYSDYRLSRKRDPLRLLAAGAFSFCLPPVGRAACRSSLHALQCATSRFCRLSVCVHSQGTYALITHSNAPQDDTRLRQCVYIAGAKTRYSAYSKRAKEKPPFPAAFLYFVLFRQYHP